MLKKEKSILSKIKIGYSIAAIGDACSYSLITTFLLFFLTSVVQINPVIAGTIAALGSIFASIWSLVIGYLSDKSISKYGRRRPFIFFATFPLGIATFMLFTTIDVGELWKVLYYGTLTIVFWISFSTFFIPYLALGAELTDDYQDRTILRSYAYVFNFIGTIIGVVAPTVIVSHMIGAGNTAEDAWQRVGIIVALFATISILITWYFLGDKERTNKQLYAKKKSECNRTIFLYIRSMISDYSEVLKIKPLRNLLGGSFFFLIGSTMFNTDRMYFLQFNIKMEPSLISKIYLISTISGIVFVPLIVNACKLMEKKTTFIVGVVISSVGLIIGSILGLSTFWDVVLISLIFGLGSSCYWQLFPSMIYDICELDEFVSEQRREGLIMSLQYLAESFSSAFAVQLLGIILFLSGLDNSAGFQVQQTMDWIGHSFTILPALFMISSVVMIFKYPITKKRHDMVKTAISNRKTGNTYEKEKIKELL